MPSIILEVTPKMHALGKSLLQGLRLSFSPIFFSLRFLLLEIAIKRVVTGKNGAYDKALGKAIGTVDLQHWPP